MQDSSLGTLLDSSLHKLCSSAGTILQDHTAPAGASAGQAALPAELAAQVAAGRERVAALQTRRNTWLLHNFAAEVQPAAAKLAAALQQYWQLPAQWAAANLDLTTAASSRACAYLRCANLSAEGGPAAGEGVGSQKCR